MTLTERFKQARINAEALGHPFPPREIIEDLVERLIHFHPDLNDERSRQKPVQRESTIKKQVDSIAANVRRMKNLMDDFERNYPDAADDARFNVNVRFNLALGDTSLSELMKAVEVGLVLTSRKYAIPSSDLEVIRIIENTWVNGRDNDERLKATDTNDGPFICFLAAALGVSNGTARERWRTFKKARANAIERTRARALERQQG
ncbi:hypothetical protein SJS40_16310 [Aeromonas caviae]|uniref:hypothetical protein n=1 Tax=Aeromonas caviae TaxID=648 RepID=UPI0029D7C50C|nr:hypothetical protein [Aeromonas caviae]MDX7755086.1 hypothetical protein [Aeromonas caviae]MDX7774706.1 hypothetical protein [Aeromonas caviae]